MLIMKKVFVFAFFLLITIALNAQEIGVKSFRALANDLDARAYYPKEDRNGEKAALVKIVTTETGFEFDAGSIGIVASMQKTGEIWLYVPRGSKALTIKHQRFTLLRNYAYPQSIEAGEVYEMVLVTGKVITTIEEPTIETQWLIITTDPAGADVYINDQPAGKTPYQNELPTGKYTWRVSKELYINEAGVAELISGAEKQVMNMKMKPNFGTLIITSIPESGANVSLNGISTGQVTPCTIKMVPPGDHSISLSREMYETITQKVSLVVGEIKQLEVKINPIFAEVSVTSEPKADIYVNGQFKNNASWQGRLNPGIYTFEAKLDKYISSTEKQAVIVGQPLNIILKPTPRTGNLKIMTTPIEVNIRINDKEMGKTPITLKNQLIGDYTVELSMHDYVTTYEKSTITEGQTAQINTIMQKKKNEEIIEMPVKPIISSTELTKVLIHTDLGDITVALYNETPKHRDNFIKLAKSGFYNGSVFHRVIKDFMVQGGGAAGGAQDAGYKIPAEINPRFFHKKGALAAARQGDQVNPKRESSGSQFYLVQGKKLTDAELDQFSAQTGKKLTPEQRNIYKTIGGTPHLDGDYTVFGEVIDGLGVIDKIAAVATGPGDKPVKDLKMTMKVL